MVRDYMKWDDTPISLQHFAESAVRAYKIAMTPPMAPVLLVADSELQENPIRRGRGAAHSEADAGHASARRFRLGGGGRAAAGAGRESGDRCGPLRADAGGHRSAGRAGRNAAGAGDRSGRTDEFPHAASAQPIVAPRRGGRQCRRDHGPRSHGLLERAEHHARSGAPHFASDHEERRETDQHHHGRPLHQSQLPGFLPLRRSRSGHGRRSGSDFAVADRGDQAAAHGGSQAGLAGSRGQAGGGARSGA